MRIGACGVALALFACAESHDGPSLSRARQRQLEAPVLSAEIALDDQDIPTIEQEDNTGVSVAAGGGIFLALTGASTSAFRVDGSGAVLDPGGIPLYLRGAQAAYVGSRFLVMSRSGGGYYWVTPSGAVTFGGTLAVPDNTFNTLSAGTNGFALTRFGVSQLTRYDANAVELGTTALDTSTNSISALASSSGNYWLAWLRCEDTKCSTQSVRVGRIRESDGVFLDPGGIEVGLLPFSGGWQHAVALGCGPSTCLVEWKEVPFSPCTVTTTVTRALRLDAAAGTPIDSTPLTLASEVAIPSSIDAISVSTTSSGFIATFGIAKEIRSVFVPATGLVPNNTATTLTSNAVSGVAMAFNGTNHLAMWGVPRDLYIGDVTGRLLTADRTLGAAMDLQVRDSKNNHGAPAVANDGENYLVVWSDFRGDRREIVAVRVDPTGKVLGPPVVLPRTSGSETYSRPKATFDGTDFVISWIGAEFGVNYESSQRLLGARIARDGTLRDATPFAISSTVARIDSHALGTRGSAVDAVWTNSLECDYGKINSITLSGAGVDPATWREIVPDYYYSDAVLVTASNDTNELILFAPSDGVRAELGFLHGASPDLIPLDMGAVFGGKRMRWSSVARLGGAFAISSHAAPSISLFEPPSTLSPLVPVELGNALVLTSDGTRLFIVDRVPSTFPNEAIQVAVMDPNDASIGPAVRLSENGREYVASSRAPGEALLAYLAGDYPSYRVRARIIGVTPASVADAGVDASRDARADRALDGAGAAGGAPTLDASRDGRAGTSDAARATGGAPASGGAPTTGGTSSIDASRDARHDAAGTDGTSDAGIGGGSPAGGALGSGGRGFGGGGPGGAIGGSGSGGTGQVGGSGGATSVGTGGRIESSGGAETRDARVPSNDLAANPVAGAGCDCRVSTRTTRGSFVAPFLALGIALARRRNRRRP